MHASDFIGDSFPIKHWTALTLRRSVKTALFRYEIWWTRSGFQSSVRLPFYQSFIKDQIAPAKRSATSEQPTTTLFILSTRPWRLWRFPSSSARDTAHSAHVGGLFLSKAFYNRLVLAELWNKCRLNRSLGSSLRERVPRRRSARRSTISVTNPVISHVQITSGDIWRFISRLLQDLFDVVRSFHLGTFEDNLWSTRRYRLRPLQIDATKARATCNKTIGHM